MDIKAGFDLKNIFLVQMNILFSLIKYLFKVMIEVLIYRVAQNVWSDRLKKKNLQGILIH